MRSSRDTARRWSRRWRWGPMLGSTSRHSWAWQRPSPISAAYSLIAAVLWYTGTSRVGTIHQGLTQVAGFVIAASGFWRLGRHLGGYGEHAIETVDNVTRSDLGLIGLGLAGGLIPCWDAVGLLVMTAALGRLAAGVGLVIAFSAGMAAVLVAVGCLAWKAQVRHDRPRPRTGVATTARAPLRRDPRGDRALALRPVNRDPLDACHGFAIFE